MKRLLIASLLAVLAVPAFAVIGTVDDVPAATLLLPYFEVDLDSANGITTLMSINNASSTSVLAHVVIWTDLSVHVLDFNVYLTGYDVQTINLRDILVIGNLPITGAGVSNVGPASSDNPAEPYPGCDALLPYSNPALDATYLDYVQLALTGQSNPHFDWDGDCGAIDHGDNIARGYVTVDTVDQCDIDFPDSPGYFDTEDYVTDENVIWGDYFYVNPGENFAQGETLVHIEADPTLGAANYTFYYRYTPALALGVDHREGLGNVFAARYVNGGDFNGGTDFLVWRDAKQAITHVGCASIPPAPFELGQSQVVVFDEEENFEVPEGCTISPCEPGQTHTPFPWETQRTHVGGSTLPSSYDFGWIYLNLNFSTGSVLDPLMQNWVTVVMDADGRYSVGYDAIQLGNVTVPANAPNDCIYNIADVGLPNVLPCPTP